MIIIGIDIGITGAVSAIYPDDTATVLDLPVRTGEDGERRIDGPALLEQMRMLVQGDPDVVGVIENIKVRAFDNRPMSHSREASLSVSRGIVQCCLDIVGAETKLVEPSTWKRFYGLIGAEKDDARLMAIKLYADLQGLFARKKDHNRAEALLIARFGQRKLVEQPA